METHKVNHKGLFEALNRCYETKVPLYIWGGTGIGKSRTVKDFGKYMAGAMKLAFKEDEYGEGIFGFYDIRVATLDPTDIRGVPFAKEKNGKLKTIWALPDFLPEHGNGIIFLDEINLAPPSMQASAYQLIRDRKAGDYKVPDGYTIIAAGNRLEDRAHTFELPLPLSARFAHVELMTPEDDAKMADSWCEWAGMNDVDGRIISYINLKKSMLYKIEKNVKAFPNPRAWAEHLSPLIKSMKSDEIGRYAKMTVGEAAGADFQAFIKLGEIIDLKKLLDNPEQAKKIVQIDQRWSVIGSLAEMYKANEKKEMAGKIIKVLAIFEPEFAILYLRATRKTNFTDTKEIQKDLANYVEYL